MNVTYKVSHSKIKFGKADQNCFKGVSFATGLIRMPYVKCIAQNLKEAT